MEEAELPELVADSDDEEEEKEAGELTIHCPHIIHTSLNKPIASLPMYCPYTDHALLRLPCTDKESTNPSGPSSHRGWPTNPKKKDVDWPPSKQARYKYNLRDSSRRKPINDEPFDAEFNLRNQYRWGRAG